MQNERKGSGSLNSYYPLARTEGLERTDADNKVLVYDTLSHHIHHLDEGCTAVWAHCDGKRTPREIGIATGIEPDRVHIALRKLDERYLLINRMPVIQDQPRLSRRRVAKLTAVAVPTIISVSAPIAAAATSHDDDTSHLLPASSECFDDSECFSGACSFEPFAASGNCL